MEQITAEQARTLVENNKDGRIFAVRFIKRTDGTLRSMNCRKGVRKGQTGGSLKFNPKSKGLVVVYDVRIRDYRMISLEGIRSVSMNKRKYQVV